MASYEDEDELPPQATTGLTRRVPTAGRSWQQRRVIQGAGSAARTVGTAWSRLTSQQREQFGNHRRFREHLSRAAMARAMQQEDAKEEAARQAGRAAANASTSATGPAPTVKPAAQPPPTSPPAAVPREESAASKDMRAGQLRREWANLSPEQKSNWAKESGADQGVPTRNVDPWKGTQWARARGGITMPSPAPTTSATQPSAPASTTPPPARPAPAPDATQEQAWATLRKRRVQPSTTPRQSYLQRVRSRVG